MYWKVLTWEFGGIYSSSLKQMRRNIIQINNNNKQNQKIVVACRTVMTSFIVDTVHNSYPTETYALCSFIKVIPFIAQICPIDIRSTFNSDKGYILRTSLELRDLLVWCFSDIDWILLNLFFFFLNKNCQC